MFRQATFHERAEALVSALAKSKNLCTLRVCAGDSFPQYLIRMGGMPSLKSIHFTFGAWSPILRAVTSEFWLMRICEAVDANPKMKALVTFDTLE